MSSTLFSSAAPLVRMIFPSSQASRPEGAPYRIRRPASPAGLGVSPLSEAALKQWLSAAPNAGLCLGWDGEAFLLWRQSFADIAKVEANWSTLATHFQLQEPPPSLHAIDPELSANCHHAWWVCEGFEKKPSTAEEASEGLFNTAPKEELPPLPEESPLVFVDVETTGGSPADGARVVQIALHRIEPDGEVYEFASRVNPEGRESLYGAYQVHKIPHWELARAPLFVRLWPRIQPLLEGAVFIAHNGRACDVPYVKNELARIGEAWPCLAEIDSLRVARNLLAYMNPKKPKGGKKGAAEGEAKERFSYSLGSLAALFCVQQGTAHDAKGDVQTLVGVWAELRRRHPKVSLAEMTRM